MGCTRPNSRMNFRPGIAFRFVMRGPDGKDHGFQGQYREIVAGTSIEFTGAIDHVPGDEVWTLVMFADYQGKTRVTVVQTHTVLPEATWQAHEGWSLTLDRLAQYIAKRSSQRSNGTKASGIFPGRYDCSPLPRSAKLSLRVSAHICKAR